MRKAHWAFAVTVGAIGVVAAWPPSAGNAQSRDDRAPEPRATAAAQPADPLPLGIPLPADRPDRRVLRLYDVSDLTTGVGPSHFNSAIMPPSLIGLSRDANPSSGLFCGGSENKEKDGPGVGVLAVDTLLEMVSMEAGSVTDNGPPAEVRTVAGMIAVRQTPAGQQRVVDVLAQLRAARPVGRGVEVIAHWVLLNPGDAAALSDPARPNIDPKVLAALPPGALYARSSTRLLTGQVATLLAGRAKTVVTKQMPVVGSVVGAYDPAVDQVLAGALLQLGVTVTGDVATVAVRAALGDAHAPDKPSRLRMFTSAFPTTLPTGAGSDGNEHVHTDPRAAGDIVAEVDRLHVTAFDLQTTAKLPLGRPTVVGGMTLEPATGLTPAKGDPRQLYLVLEVNLADGTLPATKPSR